MSKVVHLNDDAHARAKVFCKEHGLRMSEWVAQLIDEAISQNKAEPDTRAALSTRKVLKRLDDRLQTGTDGEPVYAQPPFWAETTVPVPTEE